MKKLLILTLALGLSACATIQNPLTQSRLNTINASWGAALALGANYRDACASRIIPPSCRPIVVKMQQAAIPVHAAVKAANTTALGGTVNAAQLVDAASNAINDYKVLQMTYGVQ